MPDDYYFPPHIACRPRDFKLAWFMINEIGVAAIPPSGKHFTNASLDRQL
jgi:kynurenine aminotransferase